MLVAGDVGGTKTLLALVDGEVVREESYASADYASLVALLGEFLGGAGNAPHALSLALAGPVRGSRARVTNLGWEIDSAALGDRFGFKSVRLINDVAAIRDALPDLADNSIHTLQAGEPDAEGTVAVVAPGTGLGFSATGIASEAGHASFAPVTEQQAQLWRWLREEHDHVSREDVCSGRALPVLHRFLLGDPSSSGESGSLDTPSIVAAALDGTSPLCSATVDLWVEILGGIVGDWALEVTATGGVHLAGGLSARLLPRLRGAAFLDAFLQKDRMGAFLRAVPVRVVTDERAALRGAIRCGTE